VNGFLARMYSRFVAEWFCLETTILDLCMWVGVRMHVCGRVFLHIPEVSVRLSSEHSWSLKPGQHCISLSDTGTDQNLVYSCVFCQQQSISSRGCWPGVPGGEHQGYPNHLCACHWCHLSDTHTEVLPTVSAVCWGRRHPAHWFNERWISPLGKNKTSWQV
jgi:hypothetical protein